MIKYVDIYQGSAVEKARDEGPSALSDFDVDNEPAEVSTWWKLHREIAALKAELLADDEGDQA